MPKEDAANRRDAKRFKKRHGMRTSGRSVRDLLSGLIQWRQPKKKRK